MKGRILAGGAQKSPEPCQWHGHGGSWEDRGLVKEPERKGSAPMVCDFLHSKLCTSSCRFSSPRRDFIPAAHVKMKWRALFGVCVDEVDPLTKGVQWVSCWSLPLFRAPTGLMSVWSRTKHGFCDDVSYVSFVMMNVCSWPSYPIEYIVG